MENVELRKKSEGDMNVVPLIEKINASDKMKNLNSISLVNSNNLHKHGKFFDPLYEETRQNLPVKREKVTVNVWGILRDAIGKDLSKFAMPGNYKIENRTYIFLIKFHSYKVDLF